MTIGPHGENVRDFWLPDPLSSMLVRGFDLANHFSTTYTNHVVWEDHIPFVETPGQYLKVPQVPWVPGMKQSSISNLGVTFSANALTLDKYHIVFFQSGRWVIL